MKLPTFVRSALSLCLALAAFLPVPAPAAAATAATTGTATAAATLWNTQLPNAAGVQQSLGQFKGKPLVVNFWASWCGPCVEEMPALSAMHQRYTKKGIQFVGIGIDSAANVSKFLGKVKVTYPIFVAGFGGADLARSLGDNVGALPFTVVFDSTGRVRYSKLGKIAPQELERTLDAL
jgi:thiol-disulfide isomerase/thioredoxin